MKPGDLVILAHHANAGISLFTGDDPKKLSWLAIWLHACVLDSKAVCLVVQVGMPNNWLIQVMTPGGRLGWQEARWFKKVA